MKYKNILFLILLSLLSTFSYANENVVGLLRTQEERYPHELGYSGDIIEMLNGLGANTVLVDYNALAQEEGNLSEVVRNFVKNNNIKRVIIPGNYYNLDSEPFAPNTNRQDVTTILTKMAGEQEIYLMGICGGLQGIMYAQGIEIVKVESIQGSSKQHLISDPDPHSKNVPLHEVKVNPVSRLATILRDNANVDENGWIALYLPDAHSRVVNNSVENMTRINATGYKIIGFSNDGMIEILEDKFGNLHFQDHPEGLLVSGQNGNNISSLRNASANAMIALFKDFINR